MTARRDSWSVVREAADAWARLLAGCDTVEDAQRADTIQRAIWALQARRPAALVGWHGPHGLGARLTTADPRTMLALELAIPRGHDEVLVAALLLAYRCGVADGGVWAAAAPTEGGAA